MTWALMVWLYSSLLSCHTTLSSSCVILPLYFDLLHHYTYTLAHIRAASQAPTAKIVSNAPDLQPKAPAAAAQESKDSQAEDAVSEELEEDDEEEESESDDDDVQITIDAIQPTPIPYGRTPSYPRMTIQPGGRT